ncbi:LamG-like jellyroll fold domain-containing protein [Dactylosporangium sp. NPDC050688]|uniref:LamG-like jellyroll fold domain-containing protein n=1 Tax=Dactylosporangium sp. NPDC050688 TaxID=3157217 RepID=UPI0033D99891
MQVFANANGTFTQLSSAVVQRVRLADGSWVKPDPTLRRRSDGTLEPVAASVPLILSGGGDQNLATVKRGNASLAVRWPSVLPAPVVSGSTATYPEVLPGVDLVLTAGVEGYSEVLAVKNATAAANEALTALRFPTAGTGVSLRMLAGGALSAVDGAGNELFGSSGPRMWDSSSDAAGAADGVGASSATRAATRAAGAPMPVELSGADIVVHPDLSLLRGANTKYPVYIDPAFGASAWTMINSKFTGQSYWSYDRHGCPTPYTAVNCAKVGYTDDDPSNKMTYRSLFAFGTGSLLGKHVLDAKLSMDLVYSWNSYNTDTEVRITNGINSGTTWSNNAGSWIYYATVAKTGSQAHDRVRRRQEWGVTGAAQIAVASGWQTLTLGLKAADESNHNAWKKYDAGTAVLTVIYNSYPNAPDQLTAAGNACVTGAGRPFVKTATPELRARMSDPDGSAQLLDATFYWWPLTGGSRNETDKVSQASIISGQQAIASIPAGRLTSGVTYVFQAIGYDGTDTGQYSMTCEFTVDITGPLAPATVASTEYPADGQAHGGGGVAGSFTFSPPATVPGDFWGYAYTLDNATQPAAATQVAADPSTHVAVVSVTPPSDGVYSLRVWSRDTAGNYSATPMTYQFTVRAGAGPDARWAFNEGTGTTAADASAHGNTATVTASGWTAGRGGSGSALSLNGTSTYAATSGPVATKNPVNGAATVVHTNGNLTVAATVRLTATGGAGQQVILAQDGTRTSAFQLSYSGPDDRWRFAMAGSDVDAPTLAVVLSNAAPTAGRWTYLVATYDSSTHQVKLYVDGAAQTATATAASVFDATGPVTVGRGRAAGAAAGYFGGAIDDVRVYARVLSSTEGEFVNALKPSMPLLSFPGGTVATVGQPLQVTISAGGDTAVTSVAYRLGASSWTTVALGAAGGQVTVSVTTGAEGDAQVMAYAIDGASRPSDTKTAVVTFLAPPTLQGTVVDGSTGSPVVGATVRLEPGGATQTTAVDGTYSFTGITAGLYVVTASVASTCGAFATTEIDVQGTTYFDLLLFPQSDVFGYVCQVNTGQAFIPADTTTLGLTGDDATTTVGLPFTVPFYGTGYSTAWVSTNGVVTFANPGSEPLSPTASIPDSTAPNALVAPFWDDLYVDSQASVRTTTLGTAPNRQFVIEWRNVAFYGDFTHRLSFEVIFAEGGGITFRYADMAGDIEHGLNATIGIESAGGAYGLQYSFRTAQLADGASVEFVYPSDAEPISVWTLSGTVTRGGVPVAGLPVTLLPNDATVTTDASGNYTFANLEQNGYTVTATDGCAAASAVVDLAGNTTATLALAGLTDTFGYSCTVATQAFTPADTTVLPLTGDEAATQVTLPFSVSLYGQTYSSAWVSTNGFVSFVDPTGASTDDRAAVPTAAAPNAAVYAYWDDLVVDGSASVGRVVDPRLARRSRSLCREPPRGG